MTSRPIVLFFQNGDASRINQNKHDWLQTLCTDPLQREILSYYVPWSRGVILQIKNNVFHTVFTIDWFARLRLNSVISSQLQENELKYKTFIHSYSDEA